MGGVKSVDRVVGGTDWHSSQSLSNGGDLLHGLGAICDQRMVAQFRN